MTYFESFLPNVATAYKSVLGVSWDTTTDEFVFLFRQLDPEIYGHEADKELG